MKWIQVAGIMIAPVLTDINYVAYPKINLEKMEVEGISGFDFKLPKRYFSKFYENDDFEIRITENVEIDDTTIKLSDTSLLNVGDLAWIKNELIQVVSIDSSSQITVLRGGYKTFINRYIKNDETEEYYYLRKYPKSLIGQRVFLYEGKNQDNRKIIAIGVINKEPTFNGVVVNFSCDNAIKMLDTEIEFPRNSPLIFDNEYINLYYLFKSFKYKNIDIPHYFKKEIPPIFDYIQVPYMLTLTERASIMTYININKIKTYKDLIEIYGKTRGLIFSWKQDEEVYKYIGFSDITSFDVAEDIELNKLLKFDSNYSTQLYSGISEIVINAEFGKVVLKSVNISKFANKKLEIDLSDYKAIEFNDLLPILFFYNRLFSVIYSKLTIKTSIKRFNSVKIGKIYNITDINKFFSFQNVTSKAVCIGFDNDTTDFLLIRNLIKHPIAPAVVGSFTSSNTFEVSENPQILNDTYKTDLDEIGISEYHYKFFEINDYVAVFDENGNKTDCKITNINATEIELDASFSIGLRCFITYANYDNIAVRQNKFFYLNINNY